MDKEDNFLRSHFWLGEIIFSAVPEVRIKKQKQIKTFL